MRVFRLMGFAALAGALLAGCSGGNEKPVPVSTRTEVKAPSSQKASVFDLKRSNDNLSYAQTLRQGGELAQARTYAEAAINDWPASPQAWGEMQAICQAQSDKLCQQHAEFFHDKVTSLADLPPRVAVLGLQNLLEDNDPNDRDEPKPAKTSPGKTSMGAKAPSSHDSQRIDEWTYAMAQHMMAFYDRRDKMAAVRDAPVERLVVDSYPPGTIAATMLAIGVAGYGISQAVK
jgi:hypothetical protein